MNNYILYIKDITCKINLQIIIDSSFTLRDLKEEICKKLDNDMYPCLFKLVHKGQSLDDNLDIHLEESAIESEETLHIMFVLNPEKEILFEIKRKMNIQLNWDRNLHLRDWERVEIDENLEGKYKITKINLNYLQLTGEIPKEIVKLTNLQLLALSNNQLTGEIPKEIGKLVNLKLLYLNNNQLLGEIPKEIGKLTNLQDLYLENNQLTGEIPKEIGKLVNLEWLCLNNNQLLGEIPKEIGHRRA
jgi:Leucine-rich repeat (LRR) protein